MITETPEGAMKLLKKVIDPEVGLNIVDMGLVFKVEFQEDSALVTMTLTTPGCPFGPHIMGNVKDVLGEVEGVNKVDIDLVWDPPWSADMIVPEAIERLERGEYDL